MEKAVFLLSEHQMGCQLQSKRGTARGTRAVQYLWDKEHLKKITEGKYTHKPLRVNRLGGRNPETGRKINEHVGGGVKFDYFMVDMHRRGPRSPDETYDERVIEVKKDPNRDCAIALVAGSKGKRWIMATENMIAGQIIKTTGYIAKDGTKVVGEEGYAYPIGWLMEGTVVNSIEAFPSMNSEFFVVHGGGAATIVRHEDRFTIVKMPHKHEYALRSECMATVGRLKTRARTIYGSAQMHRRFGYKMSSGLWHKKDGYQGRKIRALPAVVKITKVRDNKPAPKQKFTLTKRQLSAFHGPVEAAHHLVSSAMFRF